MTINYINKYFQNLESGSFIQDNLRGVARQVKSLGALLHSPTPEQETRWSSCLINLADRYDVDLVRKLIPKTPVSVLSRIFPHIFEGYFEPEWAEFAIQQGRWDCIGLMFEQAKKITTNEDRVKAFVVLSESLISYLKNSSQPDEYCWKKLIEACSFLCTQDQNMIIRGKKFLPLIQEIGMDLLLLYAENPPKVRDQEVDTFFRDSQIRLTSGLFSVSDDFLGAHLFPLSNLNQVLINNVLPQAHFITSRERRILLSAYSNFGARFLDLGAPLSPCTIFQCGYQGHAATMVLYKGRGIHVDLNKTLDPGIEYVPRNFKYKAAEKNELVSRFAQSYRLTDETKENEYERLTLRHTADLDLDLEEALSVAPLKSQRTGNCVTKSYIKSIFAALVLIRIDGKDPNDWAEIAVQTKKDAKAIDYLLRLSWIEFMLAKNLPLYDSEIEDDLTSHIFAKMTKSEQKLENLGYSTDEIEGFQNLFPQAHKFLQDYEGLEPA